MQPLSVIQQAALRHILKLALPSGAAILDAPCGAGALTVALREAGLDAWGADLTDDAAGALGDHLVHADLSGALPWPESRFDAIVSTEGIEHLENRFAFLREAHRVLKPGGTLLLTTPNIAALRSRVRYFFSGFYHKDPRPLNESGRHLLHHIGLATFPDLRYALHTSGFRIMRTGATHVKPVSYAYGVLAPFMYLYTRLAFRKEKDAAQRARNREIRRTLLSAPLLLGENLLIVARKQGGTGAAARPRAGPRQTRSGPPAGGCRDRRWLRKLVAPGRQSAYRWPARGCLPGDRRGAWCAPEGTARS